MRSSFNTSRPLLIALVVIACASSAFARVWFVDNARPQQGSGTADAPLTTLAAAQSASAFGDIIFVAETAQTYTGGISLKPGQMLIGSAYGLDAARVDFGAHVDTLSVPAVQGPGPAIQGAVIATGNNVIAGCTILADQVTGLVAASPQGKLTIRNVWFHSAHETYAIALQNDDMLVEIAGGGIIMTERGSGISIAGGRGAVTIHRCPFSGAAGTAVSISGRVGGDITFDQGSRIKLDDAAHDAIAIVNAKGVVTFGDPIDITTHGGRGLFVIGAQKVVARAAPSRIAVVDAAAIDIRDSEVDVELERVSASGGLKEGIALDKLRGRLVIAGGEIRDAQQYGIRVEQSTGVSLSGLTVTTRAGGPCAEGPTNLLCRAALYLRHVRDSTFAKLTLATAVPPALNGNNLEDIRFTEVAMQGGGALLEELKGKIVFDHCSVADGGIDIDQRFNNAQVIFDGATIAAPQALTASPFLLRAKTSGASRLDLAVHNGALRDNAGGGVHVESGGDSALSFAMTDSAGERLGGLFVDAVARQSSKISVALERAQIILPAQPLVVVEAAGNASACADLVLSPSLSLQLAGRASQSCGAAPLQ
jgi:hypothetical protein